MARIGIISNPRSHHNLRGLALIGEMIANDSDLVHVKTDDMADLPEILTDFTRREVGRIVVNGGDGTIQAVMTALLNGGGDEPQTLAVLPAGRTNLIAHNIGLKGRPIDGLARLLARRRRGELLDGVSRPVLSLDLGDGGPATHGMFLGSAAFYRGTMMGRAGFHPLGARGAAVVGLSVGLAVTRALLGRPGGILRGDAMTISLDGELSLDGDGEAARERDYFLVLASALDHLILGLAPFWGGGEGAVRLTTVRYPPRRLARALLPLARGRPRPWMADYGYRSRRLESVTLATACPIVFDGQTITPDPAVPLTISGDHRLSFLRC